MCEGRVERGGERHALTCLASVCLRAIAVHRLVLTLWLRMVRGVLDVSPGPGGGVVQLVFCHL